MKHKESGLFFLLAKNYLLFTVTLFLITGSVYFMWDSYVESLYESDDWNGLLADEALTEGNYKKLRRYLSNRGSAFAVLDAFGNVLFSSDAGFVPDFTEEELSFVQEFDTDTYMETFYDYDENGEIYYLIIALQTDEEGFVRKTADVVLDKDLRVVSGGLHQGKQRYT